MIVRYVLASALLLGCSNKQSSETIHSQDSTEVASSPQKPLPPKPIEKMNREERDQYKEELTKSGFYDCCIKPSCNMCLYEDDEQCSCAEHMKNDEGVCGECQKGWQKGKGALKGIDPKKVKRM